MELRSTLKVSLEFYRFSKPRHSDFLSKTELSMSPLNVSWKPGPHSIFLDEIRNILKCNITGDTSPGWTMTLGLKIMGSSGLLKKASMERPSGQRTSALN